MHSVFSVGHRHFHKGKCNVPSLPHEILEHHEAIITYVPIFLLCSCNPIYLLLTSFDGSLNRSWSLEVKHWIMSQVPSAGMPNLGQKGASTYGCHIKFYIIIGSDGAMRSIQWKWIDSSGGVYSERMKREKFWYICCKSVTVPLPWLFAPDFRNNSNVYLLQN